MIFVTVINSKSSASRGVKRKAEIASDDKMSMLSKNPSDDLPNQEKNQYAINFLLIGNMGFLYKREIKNWIARNFLTSLKRIN